ncbi:MAG: DUF4105 domain-containing protein [Bdellovibrionota bacterium]
MVTISPGSELSSAFGHSLVLVQNGETSSEVDLYEYGGVDLGSIFQVPDDVKGSPETMQQHLFMQLYLILSSSTKTQLSRVKTTIDPKKQIPAILYNNYLSNEHETRTLLVDQLNLSDEKAQTFVKHLQTDLGREESYENFTNNCATKVRDRLFADDVLGKEARDAFFDKEVPLSLKQIAMQSIDDGASSTEQNTLYLVSPEAMRSQEGSDITRFLRSFGLNWRFRGNPMRSASQNFYESASAADAKFRELALAASKTGSFFGGAMIGLSNAFHEYFFREELVAASNPRYKTLFTPKLVREALLEIEIEEKDGQGKLQKRRVIDPTKALILTNKKPPAPARLSVIKRGARTDTTTTATTTASEL